MLSIIHFKAFELTHLANLPISDITLLTCDQWRAGVVVLLTGVQENRPYVQKDLMSKKIIVWVLGIFQRDLGYSRYSA